MSNPNLGPKVMLEGISGSGKTTSWVELVKFGLEVFALTTEPSEQSIRKAIKTYGLSEEESKRLHWAYVPAATVGFDDLLSRAKKVNQLSYEALAKMGDVDKSKYQQFIQLLATMHNFVDQNGEAFGSVDTWGPERVFVLDSLSGVNIMSMDLVVGGKPTKSMPDWMVAQDNIKRLIQKLCMDTKCWFILTTHLEQERDEVTGKIELMPATLGRKLAPELPFFFDEVIHAYREGDKFYWSTSTPNCVTKGRLLPLNSKMNAGFKQLYDAWKS